MRENVTQGHGRHHDGPAEFLKHFTETMLGDCYSGFESLLLASVLHDWLYVSPREKRYQRASGFTPEAYSALPQRYASGMNPEARSTVAQLVREA